MSRIAVKTKSSRSNVLQLTPEKEADLAGLIYGQTSDPGYFRRRHGKSFRYFDGRGKAITSKELKQRFAALAIPPAWQDVWIASNPLSHIQVIGRDEKGRRQYRYHSLWRAQRDGTKFDKMQLFGSHLPIIRQVIQKNLKAAPLSKEQIMATVVHLLETTLIRIGNESYAKQNKSYGLTTIREKHVEIENSTVRFEFKGKSGIMHKVEVKDPRIARIINRCHHLPGQLLFQYIDEIGETRAIGSADVNQFLNEITRSSFTAKDFRTWSASVMAAKVLREFEPPTSVTGGKRSVKAAITEVAKALRNTVSVCRKCYVHPAIIEAYLDGRLCKGCEGNYTRGMKSHLEAGLSEDEAFLLALLKNCEQQKKKAAA